MLTARDSKRDRAQLRAAGAAAYLAKPFSQDKCIALVERTLAERRLMAYKEASALFISEGAQHAAEEPGMNGAEAVRKIMQQRPTPVVMFSAHTKQGARETFDALAAGAVDFVTKPAGEVSTDLSKVSWFQSASAPRGSDQWPWFRL